MNFINCRFPSPWIGNQLHTYCWARAYAEMHGCEFHCEDWVGQKVFDISDPPNLQGLPRRDDVDLEKFMGETNITLQGYAQRQPCLLYTRKKAKEWLRFKPEILALLEQVPLVDMAAHLRHGDFVSLAGYVAISPESYCRACLQYGLDPDKLCFVSQENPVYVPELTAMGLGQLPDFYRLMKARILFRANSTFSFWAATLGNAERIFSPNVAGIPGSDGVLRDAPFEEGNHCNFTNHCWFTTDLHLL